MNQDDANNPDGSGPRKKKRPYARPEVTKVPLRPQEAVLGFCKTASTGGPGSGTDCTICATSGS